MSEVIQINPVVLGGGGGVSTDWFTKLWENPNPTADFSAQTITLSSGVYDELLWIGRLSKADNRQFSSIVEKGADVILNYAVGYNNNGADTRCRLATYVDATHYSIGSASIGVGTSASTTNNATVIPVAVYGIQKNGLAGDVSTLASNCMLSNGDSVEDRLNDGRTQTITGSTIFSDIDSLISTNRIAYITFTESSKVLTCYVFRKTANAYSFYSLGVGQVDMYFVQTTSSNTKIYNVGNNGATTTDVTSSCSNIVLHY